MSDDRATGDFLARLAAYPGLAGVVAKCAADPAWVHLFDPDAWAWHLLPAVDLPPWVRESAQRRRGTRSRSPKGRRYQRAARCLGCHCHALLPPQLEEEGG